MPLPQFVYRSAFFRPLVVMTLLGLSLPGALASRRELVCKPRNVAFGKVVTGQSESLPVTLTNTGPSSVTVYSVNVSGAAFAVSFPGTLVLAPGQTVQFGTTFSPTLVGSVNGTATFSSSAGNLALPMYGTGVADWPLTANPPSLSFGDVQVGGSSTLPLTINNPGGISQTVSIGKVGGSGFSVSGVKLPLILAAGQSFTFDVTFAPTSAGASSGSILATSPTSPNLTVPLTGTGDTAGLLTVTPSAMNFGSVNVGQNASQSGTLTVSGASVTVSSASLNQAAFSLSGLTFPVTIATGQSVMFTVTFAPQTPGQFSSSLLFASNASNSPTSASLTGTGNVKQYTVALSWDPSSSDVVGYNVYRSGQSGGPYTKLNSTLDPVTSYSDGTVVDGQTYYYATTAVNSQGQESAYSNLSEAVIP